MTSNKLLMLFLSLAVLSGNAEASNYNRYFQDAKFPTQQMIEVDSVLAPATSTSTYVQTAAAGPASNVVTTLSTFTAQPDVTRNLSMTPNTTVLGCVVTITGTDIMGATITDTLTWLINTSTKKSTNKTFKTITSVSWPANCENSPYTTTWAIGVENALGLKHCMVDAASFFHAGTDGVKDTTAPTVVADASIVALNSVVTNAAPNAARNFKLWYMQNYRCTR